MIKILIVENEIPISNLIKVNLTAEGYHCTCAYDGKEGADFIEKEPFDLILLDSMLPEIDGYIESLKSISKLFQVSIDELLSSDELLTLVKTENQSNIRKICSLIFGILDLTVITFAFLSFFGKVDGSKIYSVGLFESPSISKPMFVIYFLLLACMSILGSAYWSVCDLHHPGAKGRRSSHRA